jgi:LysR family hydrogen peroxide-inducible transcriptional activator
MVSHQPGLTFLPSLALHSELLAGTDLMSMPLNNSTAYREIGIAWRATSYKTQNYLKMAEILQGIVEEKLGKG